MPGIFKSEKSLLWFFIFYFFFWSYQVDENLCLFKILYTILLWRDLAASQERCFSGCGSTGKRTVDLLTVSLVKASAAGSWSQFACDMPTLPT